MSWTSKEVDAKLKQIMKDIITHALNMVKMVIILTMLKEQILQDL